MQSKQNKEPDKQPQSEGLKEVAEAIVETNVKAFVWVLQGQEGAVFGSGPSLLRSAQFQILASLLSQML